MRILYMSTNPGVTENKSINITFTIECIGVDETKEKPLDWNGATASLKITGYEGSQLSPSMASFDNKNYIYLGENFIEMNPKDKNKIIEIFTKEQTLPFIDNKENPRTQHVLKKIDDFIKKMDENTKNIIEAVDQNALESEQLKAIVTELEKPRQPRGVGGTKTRRHKLRVGKKKRHTRRYYYK